MFFRYIILFILLLATSFGCARKQTATGKIRLNLGAASTGTVLNAVYIWGFNRTLGLTTAHHIVGDGRDLEFPVKPGSWNFRVVAWSEGSHMFEGTTRCGNSPDISFQGGDVDVPIHITTDCTNHPRISDPAYIDANNQIAVMRLVSCRSLAKVSQGWDLCENAYLGDTKSFRVILPSYSLRPDLEIGPFAPESLRSDCQNTPSGYLDTNLRIPVGNDSPESPRVYIESFDQPGCTGNVQFRAFPHGLYATQGINGKLLYMTSPIRSAFFLKHGDALGGGDLAIFGTGIDGVFDVSADHDLSTFSLDPDSGGTLPLRILSARRRIKSLATAVNGNTIVETATAFNTGTAEFMLKDEVMWYISISTPLLTACDSATDPMAHKVAGMFGFAHVQDISDTSHFTLDRPLPTFTNTNLFQVSLSGNLYAANPIGTPQCVVQIMRVPQFKRINVSNTSTLWVPPFSLGSGSAAGVGAGGVLVMRVQQDISVASGQTLNIGSGGMGFVSHDTSGSLLYFQGVGAHGFTQHGNTPPPDGCTGGCDKRIGMAGGAGTGAAAGGGGGGHLGAGGRGQSSSAGTGGQGGFAINFLDPFPPENVILMGASGGHGYTPSPFSSTQSGGNGGGVLMIAAQVITGSGTLALNANGADGNVVGGMNGGGGGAGGSIYVYSQYSDINTLHMYALGGTGANGLSTGCGGGGGGGGYLFFKGCVNKVTYFNQVLPVIDGGGSGNGSCTGGIASTPGGGGMENTHFSWAFPFCP